MGDITGLLLAAGGSKRFGSNKLLANLDGQPLVLHSAKTLNEDSEILPTRYCKIGKLWQALETVHFF